MTDIICITNRILCRDDFIGRVRRILDAGVTVILREKDLPEPEYFRLLSELAHENLIAHSFTDAARRAEIKKIHMPMSILKPADISDFDTVGASAHSAADALLARRLGASYVTASHIFATDCKKGLTPRGTGLIADIKKAAADMPVYALGGITAANARECIAAGADGVCAMSGFMRCPDIDEYISSLCAAAVL